MMISPSLMTARIATRTAAVTEAGTAGSVGCPRLGQQWRRNVPTAQAPRNDHHGVVFSRNVRRFVLSALVLLASVAQAQFVPPVLKGIKGDGTPRQTNGPIPFPAADHP